MQETLTLITGADKGMGFEMAKELGQKGQHILLGSRNQANGERAVTELEKLDIKVDLVILDVTDEETIQAAAQLIQSKFGYLNILINNAGIALDAHQSPVDIPVATIRKDFDVNYFGVIQVTQAMIPLLKQSETAQIINISSEMGSLTLATTPGSISFDHTAVGYQSSKAALNMWTIDLAKVLKADKINVNAVNPGWVKTSFGGSDAGALTPAEVVARTVELALGAGKLVTGTFSDTHGIVPW
ncbi:SDR family oxidoreductase [Fructilactobacillus sp. Tb1]|uniref:SDR family oxidoreductase n=1 Tax=Fructilactobacillus sp. Tb1 TaxID=3422304 RepID=UPI003D2AB7E5